MGEMTAATAQTPAVENIATPATLAELEPAHNALMNEYLTVLFRFEREKAAARPLLISHLRTKARELRCVYLRLLPTVSVRDAEFAAWLRATAEALTSFEDAFPTKSWRKTMKSVGGVMYSVASLVFSVIALGAVWKFTKHHVHHVDPVGVLTILGGAAGGFLPTGLMLLGSHLWAFHEKRDYLLGDDRDIRWFRERAPGKRDGRNLYKLEDDVFAAARAVKRQETEVDGVLYKIAAVAVLVAAYLLAVADVGVAIVAAAAAGSAPFFLASRRASSRRWR